MLMHLFLVLEVEYFSGTSSKFEDSFYKLRDETPSKKKQEILTSARVWSQFSQSDFYFPMNPIMHLIFPLSIELGTGLIEKSNAQGSVKEEPPDYFPTHEHTLTTTNIMVWNAFSKFYLNNFMAVIIHLFLPWKDESGIGYFKRRMRQGYIKENPPDARRLELGHFPRKRKDPKLMNFKDVTNLVGASPDIIQLKEEPPDLTDAVSFRGKSLNPHIIQRTNLLYLCVGKQVLRSKLFEEGGYDVDITSLDVDQLDQEEDGSQSLGGDQNQAQTFSPSTFRIIRKTPENVSAQMDLKNDFKNSAINWRTFLAHSESHTKKNQPIISSDEGDTNFTSQAYSSLADSDLCALFGVQRLNQEELNCKPTWNGFLIHERRFESWFYGKPRSHERDINFSSQPDFNQFALNLPALFGEPRLNQKEASYQTNLFGISTHQGRPGIWNHINPNSYEGVMDFKRQGNLHLPYLEAQDLPCMDQNALKTQLQRLLSDMVRFGSLIKRLSSHGFTLKLSRYKLPSRLSLLSSNG